MTKESPLTFIDTHCTHIQNWSLALLFTYNEHPVFCFSISFLSSCLLFNFKRFFDATCDF